MLPLALASLGIGAITSIPKFVAGFSQRSQAKNLRLQDTTTPEEAEQLAMSRQAAASSRLPGMGQMQNRLGMVQAGAVQNARLGAASGADFLAASGAADARRQQGEADLGMKGLQYQGQAQQQLRGDLKTASARRQRDLDTYSANKAALLQGSATNFDNGVNQLGSYAAMGLNMAAGGAGSGAGSAATGATGAGAASPYDRQPGFDGNYMNMGMSRRRGYNTGVMGGF